MHILGEEVEVKGHDGVIIPLTIIYKKGLKKDGTNVCKLEGYGAYGNFADQFAFAMWQCGHLDFQPKK